MAKKPEPFITISQAMMNYVDTVKLARSEHTARAYKNALNEFSKVLIEKWLDPQTTSVEKLTENLVQATAREDTRSLFTDAIETVDQTDGGRGLSLSGGRRIDGGDEDKPPVLLLRQAVDIVESDLRLCVAKRNEAIGGDAEFLADLHDRLHFGGAGDLDVALDGCHRHVL